MVMNTSLRGHRLMKIVSLCTCFLLMTPVAFPQSETQLRQWLRRFPTADTDGNGTLTVEEARVFMASRRQGRNGQGPIGRAHV